jgi:hypothetical protein
MKVLVCIDDTDNLESRGTGELASLLADDVDRYGWGTSSFVSRHQLLVHPDVPYTSHNSSMCFTAEVEEAHLEKFIAHAEGFLERESAEGSDPGLCVAVADRIGSPEVLVEFGRKAKQSVVTQKEAYDLASRLSVHLSAHGGTGHGVIGALAGVGLRLSGNDGRLKGGLRIGHQESIVKVVDICAHPRVDMVKSLSGDVLGADEAVKLGEKIKTVLQDGKSVLIVVPSGSDEAGASWQTCPRHLLKKF